MSRPIDSIAMEGLAPLQLPLDQGQPIRVYSFGPLSIQHLGQTLNFSGKLPQKSLLLLKTLIACGHIGKAGYMIENQLWPFVAHESAKRSLLSTTRRLRDLLNCREALVMQHGKLFLDPRFVWNDTWAFEQTLQQHQANHADIEQALRLYRARFLPDDDTLPVIQHCRDRLHQKFLQTVTDLAEKHCEQTEWQAASKLYELALAVDDISEGVYQGLMCCYKMLGQTDRVRQLFKRCEQALQEKLSVSPSKQTRALLDRD